LKWTPSPSPTVWRKRLDLRSTVEVGRVTTFIKHDPGSSFENHPHPEGEEIFVLEGIFSDHTGDHKKRYLFIASQRILSRSFQQRGLHDFC